MISAQLSLFDTAALIQSAYKVGDLVKLRKKPIATSYVKKGDIVEIAALHPLNGSIKFWNERSESWEFIHPDEIGSVVKPGSAVDSVTPAEVAVTESIPPPGDVDSVTPAEVAVTESIAPPGNDDSVTPAEVAVTESIAPPGNDDSVTPAEVAVTESIAPPGNDDLALKAISTYSPRGTARGGQYYRLSYRDGGRVRHQHIRGGNTNSPIARAKVQEVRSLLAAGIAPIEIAAILKGPPKP
jgi:hypothetical protein